MRNGIPTESRIFADRYLRETRKLERLHSARLVPGAANWPATLIGLGERLRELGSPVKRAAALSKFVDHLNTIAADEVRHISLDTAGRRARRP